MSFKLFKNISSKNKSKKFLRTDKKKQSAQFSDIAESLIFVFEKFSDHIKNVAESSIDFSKNLKSSIDFYTNFAKRFKNTALFEKTCDQISKVILQKLRTRNSQIFQKHKESSHFIISFFFSGADMIEQQQQNRSNQNIQNMIQIVIREMMSEIIQLSVTATVNVTSTTIRSNSSLVTDHSQMISKTTSKSRIDR
jgi:hypothetical protein